MALSSGYVSHGGNRSSDGGAFSAGGEIRPGGGQIGLGEADHVRWAWGGAQERPRDISRGGKKRQAQVSVKAPGEGSPERGGAHAEASASLATAQLSVAQHQAMTTSEVKNDLLDVLRMISSGSVAIQTEAPSMTRTQRTVQLEQGGAARSIALQCGLTKEQCNAFTQCSESEVMGTLLEDTEAAVDNLMNAEGGSGGSSPGGGTGTQAAGGGEMGDEPTSPTRREGGLPARDRNPYSTSTIHSRHIPHSDTQADDYPSFLAEAKNQGLCNRYGFLSLPKPPFQLPPRRSVKTIDPSTVTHLFAKHNIRLDDSTTGRLSRTLQLWTQGSGFVPKF